MACVAYASHGSWGVVSLGLSNSNFGGWGGEEDGRPVVSICPNILMMGTRGRDELSSVGSTLLDVVESMWVTLIRSLGIIIIMILMIRAGYALPDSEARPRAF